MSSVEIYQVKGQRKRRLARHENVAINPDDSDELTALTKRLAKENKIAPEDAELYVHQGRKKVTFRI